MKHVFEREFDDWKDSGKSYVSQRNTFLKIANFIRTNKFDKEREAAINAKWKSISESLNIPNEISQSLLQSLLKDSHSIQKDILS